jgi:hypothetical protein
MYLRNTEPTVEELLNDPISHLLMAHDGIQPEQVWAYIHDAMRKLKDRRAPERDAVEAESS